MKRCFASLMLGAVATAVMAQVPVFPDTPENHWAYVAVKDLANRGLIKGYKDDKFLSDKSLTRFEFASLLSRVLERLDELNTAKAGSKVDEDTKAALGAMNQDTLNEVQALTLKFQDELKTMQADLKKAQSDIDDLRIDVSDAKDLANKAKMTADDSYGAGSKRKYQITGYIQSRFISAGSQSDSRFPSGTAPSSSVYNGSYMQGANASSFIIRRSRLKVTGQLTQNTKYAIQLDASGLTSGTNQAVTVKEGNFSYTLGDGSAAYPTITFGLFANPFGYMLPLSSASTLSPERPLVINETGLGLFNGQDYDRGIQFSFGQKQMKYVLAFVNGSGIGSNDTDQRVDTIARASYQSTDKRLGIGASLYSGNISYTSATPGADRKKQLFGVDLQYAIAPNFQFMGEYVDGKYEQRSYFDEGTNKLVTAGAEGNKVSGYYTQFAYTLDPKADHPWTVGLSYDVLRRSRSGQPDSGGSWDDVNLGYGLVYDLDTATRLKLWYTNPSKVAHPGGTASPKKIGLFTAELQVKF